MKRLREQGDDADPSVRAGAALLSKVAPFELSAEQRRRIRARLDAEPETSGARLWRPAFALPVLLIVGVASATVGPRWYRSLTAPQALEAPTPHASVKTNAPPQQSTPAPAAPEPPAASEPAVQPAGELEADAAVKRTPAPRASQSGPGAALMMEALQARRAGDTARAQQLTAEYQKKYPNGALREEALAIAFESAAARKDPSARQLAQKYLASFPQGRFRKQAEQVLTNSP